MSGNDDISAAREYHEATSHSPHSIRAIPHFLDWNNQPLPFKLYRGLAPIALPRVGAPPEDAVGMSALELIGASGSAQASPTLGLDSLTRLLYYSAGITKRRVYPGGEMFFRAAACTGAMYHVELYVATGQEAELEDGLYHYGPKDHALRRLREGDWRAWLARTTGGESSIASAEAVIVLTTTFWRNAWKYRARAYRHAFWDSGTIVANLLATAASTGVPARLVMGFVDDRVNALLGLDSDKEVAVGLVALGTTTAEAGVASMKMPPLSPSTEPSSPAETDYPAIRSVHSSSSLDDETEVSRWRQGAFPKRDPEPRGKTVSLAAGNESDRHSIEHIIRWRGSSRRFKRESIRAGQLSLLLKSATRGIPMEGSGPGKMMGDLYIIANAVEGLAPGSYVYHPTLEVLELLEEGDLRRQAGYLDLEQPLAGDAAVNVYTMTALDPVLETFGNRGYRLAQMEGGVTGGKLYLAAYSLGLGATGLTFYDDDVTEFFSPHARGKSVMFLTAVGVPGGRNLPPT